MKANDYEGRRNISGERVRMKRLSMRLSQAALVAKVQTEGVVLEQDAISRIELGDRCRIMSFGRCPVCWASPLTGFCAAI